MGTDIPNVRLQLIQESKVYRMHSAFTVQIYNHDQLQAKKLLCYNILSYVFHFSAFKYCKPLHM